MRWHLTEIDFTENIFTEISPGWGLCGATSGHRLPDRRIDVPSNGTGLIPTQHGNDVGVDTEVVT